MPPNRRQVLHSLSTGLLGAVAGCNGRYGSTMTESETPTKTTIPKPTASGTYVSGLGGPANYPERPADLSKEQARKYVEALEEARLENRMRSYGGKEVADLSIWIESVYDTGAHGGHYILVRSEGYANYTDNTHADYVGRPGFYFVSPNLTVRNGRPERRSRDCETVYAADDPAENFVTPCEYGAASFRACGFHPDVHDISVIISFLGGDGTATEPFDTVFESEYSLSPGKSVRQGSVTYRRGHYRVTAALDNGDETTFRWDLSRGTGPETPPVTVLITPAGGVRIRRVPFPEISV